ncbi:MAG: hypothetical protein SF051_03535, partial [Elusimicrobiota bacterium]|nr:hypothetical protein [Elusimicrobiota bacterium]
AVASLRRQAAAHERLRGAGAVAAADALATAVAATTEGLLDSEPLSGAASELAYGSDGVYRQSQLLADDAAAFVDGRVFSGAAADGRVDEGSRSWVRRGALRLSADARSTGAGGFITLRARGDAAMAARLAELGLATRRSGGVVTAIIDAGVADLDAAGVKALVDDALAAVAGETAPSALRDLVAAVTADPKAAARRARALDGRVSGGRLLGRVTLRGDEYDAVSLGRERFLRGADGLPAYAAP